MWKFSHDYKYWEEKNFPYFFRKRHLKTVFYEKAIFFVGWIDSEWRKNFRKKFDIYCQLRVELNFFLVA